MNSRQIVDHVLKKLAEAYNVIEDIWSDEKLFTLIEHLNEFDESPKEIDTEIGREIVHTAQWLATRHISGIQDSENILLQGTMHSLYRASDALIVYVVDWDQTLCTPTTHSFYRVDEDKLAEHFPALADAMGHYSIDASELLERLQK